MREILFRGKRTMNDKWVEGYYSKYSYELGQGAFICDADKAPTTNTLSA